MKLRSTTPASSSVFVAQIAAFSAVAVMLLALPIQLFNSRPVSADKFDAQIQALQNKINSYQQEANALRAKTDSLQNALDQLSAERATLQSKIDLQQARFDQLEADIKATEIRIKENQALSGELIVESSLADDIPLFVRLASSENLSKFIDGEVTLMTVRDAIVEKTAENKKLAKELTAKQAEVKKVLDEQKAYRSTLQSKEAEQAQLIAETKGNEEAYKQKVSSSSQEVKRLREEQRKANEAAMGGNLPAVTGGTGGYPYIGGWSGGVGGFSPYVDPWGFYYQQCTSYAAWKVHDSGRTMPTWGYMYIPGHARYWPGFAQAAGISTGTTPKKGAVAIMVFGEYGHAMYVEENYGNGTILVSDYNFGWDGQYRKYTRSSSGVTYIYF